MNARTGSNPSNGHSATQDGVVSPEFDLTHARLDPAHCLAPGLFRSLKRGNRKKFKLDVTYTHGRDSIRFWGPEPLGADDLRVLQGLVALAGPGRLVLSAEPDGQIGSELRRTLQMQYDAEQKDTIAYMATYRRLAHEIGYSTDSGGAYATIRRSIERLWAVSVIVERGDKRAGFRILSHYASGVPGRRGLLVVALNPRLAEAITGNRPYTRIELSEVRALKADVARLVHQRLCGWIDPSGARSINMDTLCSYAWPERATSAKTRSRRRKSIRKALGELEGIGWSVSEYARGRFRIGRPRVRDYSDTLQADAA